MNFKVKNFADYLLDIKLLKNDIVQLSSLSENVYDSKAHTVLSQMKELEKDYLLVSRPQSIDAFSKKANLFKWNNIEKMSIDLRPVCESKSFSMDKCSKSIFDLQSYALESNLSDAHVDSIVDELEYYKLQQQKVSYYNEEFQEKFNMNKESLNFAFESLENKTLEAKQIVKNVVKFKTDSLTKINEKVVLDNSTLSDYRIKDDTIVFSVSILFFMIAFVKIVRIIRERILLKKLRTNYLKVLASIQKTTRVRVRSFGKIQKKSLSSFSGLLPVIEKTFCQKKHFEGELHFILSQNKFSNRLEVRHQASRSFHSFYEDQSSDLGIKLKLLTSDIEDASGEVMLSTKFDERGNVRSSSFNMCLPS